MGAEHDPPVVGDPAGRRLGHVVEQGAEAQRLAPGQLVGQRRGEERGDGRAVLVAEQGAGVALEHDHRLEDLEGVAGDVAVVVAVLLDSGHRVELGEDHRRQPELAGQPQPVERARGGEDPLELAEDALGGDAGQAGSGGAGGSAGLGVGVEVELAGEAHEPQRAQGVGAERVGAGQAQAPGGQVAGAAERVDQAAAGQRLGDRVDGEVAERQVGDQGPAADRVEVGLPGAVAGDHAPGAELVGELEGRRPGAAGDRPRGEADVAVDHEVDVGRRTGSAERVADGAADHPGRRAGQRAPGELERPGHGSGGAPSRW